MQSTSIALCYICFVLRKKIVYINKNSERFLWNLIEYRHTSSSYFGFRSFFIKPTARAKFEVIQKFQIRFLIDYTWNGYKLYTLSIAFEHGMVDFDFFELITFRIVSFQQSFAGGVYSGFSLTSEGPQFSYFCKCLCAFNRL